MIIPTEIPFARVADVEEPCLGRKSCGCIHQGWSPLPLAIKTCPRRVYGGWLFTSSSCHWLRLSPLSALYIYHFAENSVVIYSENGGNRVKINTSLANLNNYPMCRKGESRDRLGAGRGDRTPEGGEIRPPRRVRTRRCPQRGEWGRIASRKPHSKR